MFPSLTKAFAFVSLLCNIVSAVDTYWNLPATTINGFTIDLLTGGIVDSFAYPANANSSMNNNIDSFYNPSAYIRLLDRLAELRSSNKTLVKRELDKDEMLANMLTTTGLELSVNSVYSDADNQVGSTGPATPKYAGYVKRDGVTCSDGYSYVADYIKTANRWITNSYWYQNTESYWSGASWLLGTTSDLLGIASSISGWVMNGSTKTSCNGFTYALYDDSNIANSQHLWIIGGAPWTTGSNCDTTASLNTITEAIQESLLDDDNRHIVGVCNRMTNSGTWYCDVRIIIADLAASCGVNLWNMGCNNI